MTVETPEPLDPARFRHAMAHLAAAVTLITSAGASGRVGFTATAVCSVSDRPPTLLVCMNRHSLQNAAFRENGVLCVNVLAEGQRALSPLFAGQTGTTMEQRFAAAEWSSLTSGAPALKGALVSFDCRIRQLVEVATHDLFICDVVDLAMQPSAGGLVYFARCYHDLRAAAAAARA